MGKQRKVKILLLLLTDILIILAAYIGAFYIRYSLHESMIHFGVFKNQALLIVAIYIISLALFKMYRSIWGIAGIDEAIYGALACITAGLVNFLTLGQTTPRVPRMVIILACIFITIGVIASRLSLRIIRRLLIYGVIFTAKNTKKVLIIGAGSCAHTIISEIKKYNSDKMHIVGLIDDDINKKNAFLAGVKVLGNRNTILKNVEKYNVDQIVFAISSATAEQKSQILDICKEAKVEVKIIPGVSELIDGKISLGKMRDVDLKDLLGRDEVLLDKSGIASYLENKTVLVTGGGGSIGSELCRQIAKFNPKKLVILDIYENNAYDLQMELNRTMPNLNKDVIITSVRDRSKLEEIFTQYKPQVVFHAAAHKHVPLMEFTPSEAIKNNVLGTYNVAECANRFKAERFVLISTDKAVNPTNVMGATKRMCEIVVQAFSKESKTKFVAVRFGNVLGSNGSVIPLFKKQIKAGGPVTLTDKNITRFFMLIPEAAQLVLQAGAFAEGGEIFVLDMGKSVKIYDLAENLIKLSGFEPHRDIKIEVTGLRPGEKLYEELLMDEEGLTKTVHEKIFIGKPGDFTVDEVKGKIASLLNICIRGNKQLIKDTLKEVVPTYREPWELEAEKAEMEVAASRN